MTTPLNIRGTASGLVRTVRELVGSQLSEYGPPPNNRPAVFIARKMPPKPSFPYAVVDFLDNSGEGYSTSSEYVDNSDDSLVHEYDYTISFFIDIHTDDNDDSMSICTELRDRIFTDRGLGLIEEHTNYRLLDVSAVDFSSNYMSTIYEEVSRIVVEISARSIINDDSVGVIENISVDGELYVDYDQTDPPITVSVTAP